MNATDINEVIEELHTDIVSCGWMLQATHGKDTPNDIRNALEALLSDHICIGDAQGVDGRYVKFVAWSGSKHTCIDRAIRKHSELSDHNKDYAFWLCLKQNVDEYEDSQQGVPPLRCTKCTEGER